MNIEEVNALSTAVIAFVTILGLMVGFYYNLQSSKTEFAQIIFFEIIIVIIILLFISLIRGEIEYEEG